ncbi:MAG: DUF3108 domain-containing protein [Prevotellaceae bacterium]|nr:DUF3108 domain-containing protein [Candidatus Minthosoma equi]
MKRFYLIFLLFCTANIYLGSCCFAQCPSENKAFQAGETLTYDLYFNWQFVWVKCGAAHYTFRSQNYQGKPALRNDLLFTSNKRCDAVFTMRDTLISYISPKLVPLYFRKGSLEGKNYTVDEVWYSYPNGKSHVKQHYLNRHGEWSEHKYESDDCNYDMLSILSLARSFDPKNYYVGQKINFPMTTGKKVEQQTLIYKGKKNWKANDKKTYRCLVFSLLDYEEGTKDKELLRFYITDDKNHLPVRIDFFLKFGSAKAFFVKGEGLKNAQTAIVK